MAKYSEKKRELLEILVYYDPLYLWGLCPSIHDEYSAYPNKIVRYYHEDIHYMDLAEFCMELFYTGVNPMAKTEYYDMAKDIITLFESV